MYKQKVVLLDKSSDIRVGILAYPRVSRCTSPKDGIEGWNQSCRLVWEPFNLGVNSDAVTWIGLWGGHVSVSDQLSLRPLHADSDSWNSPQVICLLVLDLL
jgi:hypothetical protein